MLLKFLEMCADVWADEKAARGSTLCDDFGQRKLVRSTL